MESWWRFCNTHLPAQHSPQSGTASSAPLEQCGTPSQVRLPAMHSSGEHRNSAPVTSQGTASAEAETAVGVRAVVVSEIDPASWFPVITIQNWRIQGGGGATRPCPKAQEGMSFVIISFVIHIYGTDWAGPVAQSVERWTPYGGSIRPGFKSPGFEARRAPDVYRASWRVWLRLVAGRSQSKSAIGTGRARLCAYSLSKNNRYQRQAAVPQHS